MLQAVTAMQNEKDMDVNKLEWKEEKFIKNQ